MEFNTSLRPDAQQTALLRAALLDGERARVGWREWRSHFDLDHLPPDAYPLLPLLYRNLERNGVEDPWLPILKGVYRRNWYQNQTLLGQAAAPLRALEEAGVETMLLYGTALAAQPYADGGVWALPELEIAVPAQGVSDAIRVLRALGWCDTRQRARSDELKALTDPHLSYHHVLTLSRSQHRLKLFWHPCPRRRHAAADRLFWSASIKLDFKGVATRILSPTDLLLLTCVEGIRWSPRPSLQWMAAATAILRSSAAELDWDRMVDRARVLHLGLALREALGLLTQALEVTVPPSALRALDALPASWTERLEHRNDTGPPRSDGVRALAIDRYQHFHQSTDVNATAALSAFLRYLQTIWGIERLWQVPFYGAAKTLRYLSARPGAR
jgi:hypothetical protein